MNWLSIISPIQALEMQKLYYIGTSGYDPTNYTGHTECGDNLGVNELPYKKEYLEKEVSIKNSHLFIRRYYSGVS